MRNVASSSPLVTISERLRYQVSRGLRRSFSLPRPSSMSQVHLTSAAVKGLPSCHLTPWRSLNVSAVPSSFQAQLSASSGRIASKLFCAMCWSNRTRLLKTDIAGVTAKRVDSSWIDMLAGLLLAGMRRIPPDFCARALGPANAPASSAALVAIPRIFILPAPFCFASDRVSL